MTASRWNPDPTAGYGNEPLPALDVPQRHPAAPAVLEEPTGPVAQDWEYQPDKPSSQTRHQEPAQWGARGRIVRGSHSRIKLAPGPAEAAHRAAEATINLLTPPASRLVMVANEKGGAGKTPTALIIGALISELRRNPAVIVDVNEMRGSLGLRAQVEPHGRNIVDVLANQDRLGSPGSPAADLEAFLRRQPEGHLVLASTSDGNLMRELTGTDVQRVYALLHHRYGLVIADTGNNAASPTWGATLGMADVLVIPASPVESHLAPAQKLLALTAAQQPHLVSKSVLVITSSTGRELPADHRKWFTDRGVKVLYAPADPEIAADGPLTVAALSTPSRRAWTLIAAQVMEAAARPSANDQERN